MVCHRSSTNVYSQSLLSAVIENHGEEAAKEWAAGMVNNFARTLRAATLTNCADLCRVMRYLDLNTYYFARALRKDVDGLGADDMENIGWVFPHKTPKVHMNLSGGGVAASAPNRDNAILFLEYLASDQAQEYFSAGMMNILASRA